jgi:hypothetical protein
MVDDYQSHLCWSVDVHSWLLWRLVRLAVAVGYSLLGCPASSCIVFCRVEDVEHVLQRHNKALGFGLSDQLFQLGLLVRRALAASTSTLTGLGSSGHGFTTSLLL